VVFVPAGLILAAQCGVLLDEVSGWKQKRHYDRLRAFVLRSDRTPPAVGMNGMETAICLSFTADGLMNRAHRSPAERAQAAILLDSAINILRGSAIRPFTSLQDEKTWGHEGLYLTHLNIVLGAHRRVTASTEYASLNETISRYLARKMLANPRKNMRSYTKMRCLWPADNAATLYSLYLYDKNSGDTLSRKPIAAWIRFMNSHGTDTATGLHRSELTGTMAYSPYPRGCALSWTVKYMSEFAPEEARRLWRRYKKHHGADFIFAYGLREYAPGVTLEPDCDSGPIFRGIGSAATGLALPASKYVGDGLTYYRLSTAMAIADLLIGVASFTGHEELSQTAHSPLAVAIRFSAESR
jgi:hypothetical protein